MLVIIGLAGPGAVLADEVTDWNQHTINLMQTTKASSIATMRILAIEQAAVFDAVNGIERRFTHIYVRPDGPRRASARAAAVQAAYTTLVRFFPTQKSELDAQREASLTAITGDNPEQIKQGIRWGQRVAEEILAQRCGDGFDAVFSPFSGGSEPGRWRPTPPSNLAGQTPELARLTAFVMITPDQFRPAGPRSLTSAQYAADFNEVKALGKDTGSTRTDEQTQIGLFWGDNNQIHWNRIALYVAANRSDSLSDNARLFALLNLAASDATIIAWDAKYHYNHWRPITAIRLANTDGNDETVADTIWTPFQTTPNHQEYVSGHSTVSGAAARVLALLLGDGITFAHGSDTLAGVTRIHASFSAAAEEANESRIFTGAHFRSSCNDGQEAGTALGNMVVTSLARPNRDKDHDLFDFESNAELVSSAPVCPSPMTINPPTLPNGTLSAAYSQTLKAYGGYPPQAAVGWLISAGTLPDGLMLNPATGVLSGIPTATGTFNFTVKAYKSGYYNCSGERAYTVMVKTASATTMTVSDNPVVAGQTLTLNAQVSAPVGITPTGTVQFSVNGSPVGNAVSMVGGTASLNISPTGSSSGYFIVSASYSGDSISLPSNTSLTVTVYDYLVRDDTTGDVLYFSSSGAYVFKHYAGQSTLILKGKGMIVPSAGGCTVFLEHFATDREVTAEANTCDYTGTATVIYQGVTYILTQGSAVSSMNLLR